MPDPASHLTEPTTGRFSGRQLAGRYTLSRRLGEGATAEVYAAEDNVLGVTRAIKLLSGGGMARKRLRSRLQSEARGMAALEHPNILPILDVGAEGPLDYVVMKLAQGGSPQDRLDTSGPIPADEACGFVIQRLSALDAAHSQNHRAPARGNVSACWQCVVHRHRQLCHCSHGNR